MNETAEQRAKPRRWLRMRLLCLTAVCAAILAVVGFRSSSATAAACEVDTKKFLNECFPRLVDAPVRWLGATEVRDVSEHGIAQKANDGTLWGKADWLVARAEHDVLRLADYRPIASVPMPWAFVKSAVPFPFVVRVDYSCQAGHLAGRGGGRFYLACFGHRVCIHDAVVWIS